MTKPFLAQTEGTPPLRLKSADVVRCLWSFVFKVRFSGSLCGDSLERENILGSEISVEVEEPSAVLRTRSCSRLQKNTTWRDFGTLLL